MSCLVYRTGMLVIAFLTVAPLVCSCRGEDIEGLLKRLRPISLEESALREIAGKSGFKPYVLNPVLTTGSRTSGDWDAGALGSASVVKVNGVFHLYYEAWGVSDAIAAGVDYSLLQIGHAVSLDGLHWRKDPANPVIAKGSSEDWDAKGTWDPFIICENHIFKMWYGGGIHPRCDWGYAESTDGQHFSKRGRISQLHHVEDDHIVHDSATGRFYMYYWNRQYEPQGLFRAESLNATDFDFANALPLTIDGDTEHDMYKFTHIVREGEKWFMFYADFVRPACAESTTRLAASDDGVHWKSVNRSLFAGHDADIVPAADNLYLAYYGPRRHFDQLDSDIRVAIYEGTLENLQGFDEPAPELTHELDE